ncbi:MAG: hypothetical protein ABI665_03725 [Vicinamibacterales bacterium]
MIPIPGVLEELTMIPAAFVLLPMMILDAIILAMVVSLVHDARVRRVKPHL